MPRLALARGSIVDPFIGSITPSWLTGCQVYRRETPWGASLASISGYCLFVPEFICAFTGRSIRDPFESRVTSCADRIAAAFKTPRHRAFTGQARGALIHCAYVKPISTFASPSGSIGGPVKRWAILAFIADS